MSAHELTIWSMALGAIATMTLARTFDLFVRPSLSQLQGVGYHATVFLLVLILSGVAGQMWPQLDPMLKGAQVLAGPCCVGLSNFWLRGWLNASQRDLLMASMLRISALLLPAAGLACFALPEGLQIPAAGAVSFVGGSLTLWLTVRAWLMGDRLAPVMATGCLLTLPALVGLHAVAMGVPGLGLGLQALVAFCAALSNGFTGFVLWRRDRHEWRARHEDGVASQLDPVTKLSSGVGLVRKLIKAQRRRGRTRRDGAVLAILLFDVDKLMAQVGSAGVNEMFICMASRIQRQVGLINTVGRYYDRCFVSLVETIQSPAWLRTRSGCGVASSLRRPMEVTGPSGGRAEIRADIGVGVVHLSRGAENVEDILHDAQRMAQAARTMRSRAAILDPMSGEVVPVEQANLGPRRHGHARLVPHAI